MKASYLPRENNPLVCVIDDELSIRDSLGLLLCAAGLKVQSFSSAQEFLTCAPQETLSYLLLDVQLPGITGLDLQRELAIKDIQIPIELLGLRPSTLMSRKEKMGLKRPDYGKNVFCCAQTNFSLTV